MQLVGIGLLLFSVTWAAPTFQPQTVKTSQGCVEEQKQEEKCINNVAFDPLEQRSQEATPNENITQKTKTDLSLFAVSENIQSTNSSNLSAKTQAVNDNPGIHHKENVRDDLMMPWIPESTAEKRTEGGDDAISHLFVQEEYGAILMKNSMRPVMVTELWKEGSQEKTRRNVLNKSQPGVNDVKAHSGGKKNQQRGPQDHTSSIQSKSNHHMRRDTHYLTQLPRGQNFPSDFEGSTDTDPQGNTGDNGQSPFSGDGQPFKDFCGEGGVIGPDIQTEISGQGGSETINLDPRVPGYNELPERDDRGGTVTGASRDRVRETGTGVSLVEGSNDIIGNSDFRQLPGKEGNSQNAHQGKVELHYPNSSPREKGKEGGRDTSESANYNEIPKHGKGSYNKRPEQSNRNEVTLSEKPRLSSQGKRQGLLTPSHGLGNEIRNEMGSHNVPSRQSHDGQHNSPWNKERSQRRGPWSYRRPHSHRSFRPSKRGHSSEASDTGSSSSSEGD